MNFPCIKAFRTTPKSMIECILKRVLSVLDPNDPPRKPSNRFYKPQKWSEVTFSASMQTLRILLENAVFEAILIIHQISSRFNGRFRTKECSKRKVFGDLFGPKCDGEYISDLFETFGADLKWSEMLFQCQ